MKYSEGNAVADGTLLFESPRCRSDAPLRSAPPFWLAVQIYEGLASPKTHIKSIIVQGSGELFNCCVLVIATRILN